MPRVGNERPSHLHKVREAKRPTLRLHAKQKAVQDSKKLLHLEKTIRTLQASLEKTKELTPQQAEAHLHFIDKIKRHAIERVDKELWYKQVPLLGPLAKIMEKKSLETKFLSLGEAVRAKADAREARHIQKEIKKVLKNGFCYFPEDERIRGKVFAEEQEHFLGAIAKWAKKSIDEKGELTGNHSFPPMKIFLHHKDPTSFFILFPTRPSFTLYSIMTDRKAFLHCDNDHVSCSIEEKEGSFLCRVSHPDHEPVTLPFDKNILFKIRNLLFEWNKAAYGGVLESFKEWM
jgi:hypothetical protein